MSSEKVKAVLDEVKKAMKGKRDSGELPDLPEDSPQLQADVEKLKELVNAFTEKLTNAGGAKAAATPGIHIHWVVYVLIIVVFVSTIGLFGYRLVQSLQEKERKREEKRKLKESKKKK